MTGSFTMRGGRWVVAQSVLLIGVITLGVLFHGQWRSTVTFVIGSGLFVFGGWLGVAGVRALGRNRTPYPQPLEDSTLVQHGVYGLVRHPLYGSLMFASVGWALIWRSWPALAAAGALTLLLHAKAIREERWLLERYPEYRDYARRVKRFVPGLF